MTEVWTLTVDSASAKGIVTQVFATEKECFDSLRVNYDDEGEHASLSDGDMLQALIDQQGLEIYVDSHEVEIPLPPPLFIYADLSTGHLPQSEMDSVTEAPPRVITHEYGAWVNVPPEEFDNDDGDWTDFPALHAVIAWGRARNVCWINFDRDGDTTDALPTWEW